MSQKQTIGRRRFLATTSAAAAATIVPRHVLGGPGFVAPSDKVNVAIIGVGGQGRTNAPGPVPGAGLPGHSPRRSGEDWDLSAFYFGGRAGRGPVKAEVESHYAAKTPNYRCATYEDFRVMLEKEKAIDAVLIATPDHLHAYVSILAMKAGKHVYCEKPLTHNVWEARTVARVAKETGVATQMGNQGRSSEGHRQTAEWIWDGAIGAVREVHAWSGAGGLSRGRSRGPRGRPTVPRGSTGTFGSGRATRTLSSRLRAVQLARLVGIRRRGPARHGDPQPRPRLQRARASTLRETVEATASGPGRGGLLDRRARRPTGSPRAGSGGPVGLLVRRRPAPADPARASTRTTPSKRLGEGDNGILFVGEKGLITCGGWSGMPRLLPLELHREYVRPAKTLPRVEGHHADWIQACKGGKPASQQVRLRGAPHRARSSSATWPFARASACSGTVRP